MNRRPVRLHYFKSRKSQPNFGDELAPLVVSYVTGRPCEHASRWSCELVGIGSILDRFVQPKGRAVQFAKSLLGRRTKVWGSGLIAATDPVAHGLDVLAVRGRSTANALGLPAGVPLGDPAILIGEMFQERAKTHAVGIVPHYTDKTHPAVERLAAGGHVKIIDVNRPPLDVVRDISTCETIVSSSLHGLIVADALEIPNVRVSFHGKLKGGDFKFGDYASGVGREDIAARAIGEMEPVETLFRQPPDFGYQKKIAGLAGTLKRTLADAMA